MSKFQALLKKGNKKEFLSVGSSTAKFSTAEIVILLLFSIALDIYEIIASITTIAVVGVVLHVLGIFIDIIWIGAINLIFIMKGGRWALNLIGDLVELIPGVDLLPIRTFVLIIAIYLSNRSQTSEE